MKTMFEKVKPSHPDKLADRIAEAEAYFSAVTLVLVGDGHRDPGQLPAIRLTVGCNVADELLALE